MAKRLKAMGQPNYANGFQVTLHERMLELPLKWQKPQTIFVNSMSDLFHEKVPDRFIHRVFEVMKAASWHRFQVLTKRSGRLASMASRLPWPNNVWMGVTVENENHLFRLDDLRGTPARIKFCSIEPLLGPISDLNLTGIDWIIVGGESGPGARPMHKEWVRPLRDLCVEKQVPFFFKQWGGFIKKQAGCLLDGSEWKEQPLKTSGVSDYAYS
jgi:protein gp37